MECDRLDAGSGEEPWTPSTRDRWRGALDGYQPSVGRGNSKALGTPVVGLVHYLNAMHERIHALFADRFEKSLSLLSCQHPLNDRSLVVRLEIVLSTDGHVEKMGVVRPSPQIDFDLGALDSVDRAQPFGNTPSSIRSPDGRVYLHWDFHRDEVYACSTMEARPYLLASPDETR